ncbi:Uma2 family endonuclease, partial [Phormidium sp. CCY1219]|nr:Uma2 family endonuclease [Phormidium sp. CCY1219]
GVQEYIVWQIYENKLDWFILQESRYVALEPDENGILRSQVFPGLWLSVEALRQRNGPNLQAVLQQGLQTPEHQEFLQRLGQS